MADFRGKPVILHFWATWCPYCKRLQPALNRIYMDNKDKDLVLLGISWTEDKGTKPQEALELRGHSFKTLINGDEVAKHYGVKGTPTTMFIDREGNILATTNTSDPKDPQLERLVKTLLKTK